MKLRAEAMNMRDSYKNFMYLIEDSERVVERRKYKKHLQKVRKEVKVLAQEQRKTHKIAHASNA